MPPSNESKGGWIRGDQLILPRQVLSPEQVAPFLDHLFREIARKPKRLKLKETARVARYLKAVAVEAPGSRERDVVNHLADVIWLTMLDSGQIELAQKQEAIEFLKDHAQTYLASFDVERIVAFLENRREPSRHAEFFQPPKLLGKERSASGGGPAQLRDDLTERIYVAYHALRRTGIRDARGRIAAVLNQLGYATHARPATLRAWSSAEVIERVRQFEDRIVRRHRLGNRNDLKEELLKRRRSIVDSWIHGFHSAEMVKSGPRPSGCAQVKPLD